MLMREEFPFYQLSWSVILPVVVLGGGFTFLIVTFGVKSLRRRTTTGSEGLIGMTGVAKTDLFPSGQILVHGELWGAISEEPLKAGAQIQVTSIDGLTLHVKPLLSGKEET
jgi:membrane-bound serine protease (ClpP class)